MTEQLLTPAGVLAGLLAERAETGAMTAWAVNDFVISVGLAGAELRALAKAGGCPTGEVMAMADQLHKWCGHMERNSQKMIHGKRPTPEAQDQLESIIRKMKGWIADIGKGGKEAKTVTNISDLFGLCSDHEHMLMLLYSEPARHGGLQTIDDFQAFINQVEEVGKALGARAGGTHPEHAENFDFGQAMARCADDLTTWARRTRCEVHLMFGGEGGQSLNATGHEAVDGVQTLIGYWLSYIVQHGPLTVQAAAA